MKHRFRLSLWLALCVGLVLLTNTGTDQPEQVRASAASRPVSLTALHGPAATPPSSTTTTTTEVPPAPVTSEPEASTVPPTTAPPETTPPAPQPVSYTEGTGVWYDLAECESHNTWDINTGNGYYGGLQEDITFWNSYKDEGWPSRPDLATPEQQIIAAIRARDSGRGYRPWPACARKLGLM